MMLLALGAELLPWVLATFAGVVAGGGLGWWIASGKRTCSLSSAGDDRPSVPLSAVLSAAHAGTFELEVESEHITGCTGFRSLFGFENQGPLLLSEFLSRLHNDDRIHIENLIKESTTKKAGYFVDCRVQLPLKERWVSFRAEPIIDENGQVERLAGTLIDITDRKQAEEALKESEQRFRSLFEHNIDGVFSVDLEGRFQNANPAALRISGYSLEELRTLRFVDVCAPDMVAVSMTSFQNALAGVCALMETAIIRKDGVRVELMIRGTPIIVNDKPVGVFGVAEDISERKRAQKALDENESRLQLALEAGQMGLWTWDLESDVVLLDAANCQLFGLDRSKSTLPPEELFLRIHPEDVATVRQQFDAMLVGLGDYSAEFRVLLPEEKVRWLAGRGRVVRNSSGKAVQVVGVNFDVTQHQVATEQLNLARIAAETASRAKDHFIAALSHELRTPLNPVLILASDQERNPELSPQLRADFGLVRKNVELEAHLIDDLLDLTRIARGKLRLDMQIVDIQALCHDAVEVLQADINSKGLNLQVECPATHRWVSGDAVRLQQILWNLLKNAVKFTPVGGRILVEVSDQNDSAILIRIQDTGIGIDSENLEKIFDAFEQGDSAISRRFGGLGLGLAISRTLVEMHGGRIWASSEGRDHGTCFHLELPAVHPTELPPMSQTPADQPSLPRRILLVEDDEATRVTLERLLTRRGHQVTAVASTAAARDAAREAHFEVLISDLGLPDGSGHDLMAQLRDTPGLHGIALSGYGMEEDVARSLASGFGIHLTKPIDIRELDRAIARVSQVQELASAL